MGDARNTSMVLDNLPHLSIVTGSVNCGAGTDAALTSNDPSSTLTRVAAGEYTVTFGQAFMSTPTVNVTFLQTIGTATTSTNCVVPQLEAVSTAAFTVNLLDVVGATNATTGDQSDGASGDKFHFVAIGMRNR